MANTGAIADPIFQPAMRVITAVTNANPAAITTSFDHDFVSGETVRLVIPTSYGMQQVNKRTGIITVTGADTFTIDIDTTKFDVFAVPASSVQNAEVVPVSGNSLYNATENTLPDLIR